MIRTPDYPISRPDEIGPGKAEAEQAHDLPIIDIIRHGENDRKESKAAAMNPKGRRVFDLNLEGIATLAATAAKLAEIIDKKNEVVLIISSPAWRTEDSALEIEKGLQARGVTVLNEYGDIKLSKAIAQGSVHHDIVERKYLETKAPGTRGDDLPSEEGEEVGRQARAHEALGFQRFLRHMTNIYNWLDPETIAKIKGKKLRIICLAHQETTQEFLTETFGEGEDVMTQANGQILEITPRSKLRKGGESQSDIRLGSAIISERKTTIRRGFKPEVPEK